MHPSHHTSMPSVAKLSHPSQENLQKRMKLVKKTRNLPKNVFRREQSFGCSLLALFPRVLQSSTWLLSVGLTLVLACCNFTHFLCQSTYGSGVYMGLDAWRIYCVEWNTRNASPAKKSREESKPATGRRRNPVQAEGTKEWCHVFDLSLSRLLTVEKFVNCFVCSLYVKQTLTLKKQGIFYPYVPPSQYLSICIIVPLEGLERDLRHRLSAPPSTLGSL